MIADTVQNNEIDLQTNNCRMESILKYNILPVPLAIFVICRDVLVVLLQLSQRRIIKISDNSFQYSYLCFK